MRMFKTRAASAALFNLQETFDQTPNSVLVLERKSGEIVYAQ